MEILIGVDTLSYHCRLEEQEISLPQVLIECASLQADFVQLNAHHLREMNMEQVADLRRIAETAGLSLTLSGDVVGRASRGDSVMDGARRVAEWAATAEALGSPYVRVSSGFYRNEARDLAEVDAEREYVIAALRAAVELIPATQSVLLENHSDFTPEEFTEIIRAVESDRVGVFLDIINPVSMLLQPRPVVELLAPVAPAGHAKDYRLVSQYVEDGFHRRGFDVQYCYPGEGVADIAGLVGIIASQSREEPYMLSIEGLDNHPHIDDQAERLSASLALLRAIAADAGSPSNR